MYKLVERYNDALANFSRVRDKLPNDRTVYFARGEVYQLMGNHRLAIRDFDKAIELYP